MIHINHRNVSKLQYHRKSILFVPQKIRNHIVGLCVVHIPHKIRGKFLRCGASRSRSSSEIVWTPKLLPRHRISQWHTTLNNSYSAYGNCTQHYKPIKCTSSSAPWMDPPFKAKFIAVRRICRTFLYLSMDLWGEIGGAQDGVASSAQRNYSLIKLLFDKFKIVCDVSWQRKLFFSFFLRSLKRRRNAFGIFISFW